MTSLEPHNDPMGNAIKHYHEGYKRGKIRVFSRFMKEEKISVRYLFRSLDDMPVLENIALESCRGKILDIGAGAGCHSLLLQNRNDDVTALDISVLSAGVMKKRGIKKVVNQDIFEYLSTTDEKYDTLLMMMNGIGVAGNLNKLKCFLQKAKKILKPGGEIIFDSSNIEYLYDIESGDPSKKNGNYYGVITYRMKYRKIKGEKFNWLYLDYDSAVKIAAQQGYKLKLLARGDHFDYLAKFVLK